MAAYGACRAPEPKHPTEARGVSFTAARGEGSSALPLFSPTRHSIVNSWLKPPTSPRAEDDSDEPAFGDLGRSFRRFRPLGCGSSSSGGLPGLRRSSSEIQSRLVCRSRERQDTGRWRRGLADCALELFERDCVLDDLAWLCSASAQQHSLWPSATSAGYYPAWVRR